MQSKYALWAYRTVIAGGIFALVFLFCKYLLSACVPFLLAYFLSLPVKALSKKITKATKIPRKICAVFILTVLIILMCIGIKLCICALMEEISEIVDMLSEDPQRLQSVFDTAAHKLSSLKEMFSFVGLGGAESMSASAGRFRGVMLEAVSSVVSFLGEKISDLAIGLAANLPSALLFCVATLMSCFYFACDEGEIEQYFAKMLPEKTRTMLYKIKDSFKQVMLKYIGASLLLCLITFLIVFTGLACLQYQYAMFMAVIVAAVDILPLLGSGAVLVPWGVICFLNDDPQMGVSVLVIWAVSALVRQIAEPKIIGKNIGLHPLAALISVYVGAKIFGVAGLFFAPIVAVGIKAAISLVYKKRMDDLSPRP
ncbi:MAG: sporulation integral membrane protein YtvI [Ruminococcaceae bacterium]|nr:sporulation integral membrane protein YtvI [Oscillospiraceae bacterium]